MIEGAAEETGLTFLQVKNWIRRRNRVERTRRRRQRQSVSQGAKLHSAKGILLRNLAKSRFLICDNIVDMSRISSVMCVPYPILKILYSLNSKSTRPPALKKLTQVRATNEMSEEDRRPMPKVRAYLYKSLDSHLRLSTTCSEVVEPARKPASAIPSAAPQPLQLQPTISGFQRRS